MESSENLNLKDKLKKNKNSEDTSVPNFLQKTYDILQDQNLDHIIAWSEDGKALIIKDGKKFSDTVLPSHFKHGNISSFIRQLNMYDFKKIKSKLYEYMFAHDMFQRGRRELLRDIRRKSSDVSLVLNKNKINIDDVSERDASTLQQENVILKKVQKEMMEKIKNLEHRVNELVKQNDILGLNLKQVKNTDATPILSQSQVHQPIQPPYAQKVQQYIQVQMPGQMMPPQQWNPLPQQNHAPQVMQVPNGFQMANGSFDPMRMILPTIPQNFMPHGGGQMSFMMLPMEQNKQSMEQGKQMFGMMPGDMNQLLQNGMMMIPQMNHLYGNRDQEHMTVKTEEIPNSQQKLQNGVFFKNYGVEGDSKGTSSEKNESQNDSDKSDNVADLKQGSENPSSSKAGFRRVHQSTNH